MALLSHKADSSGGLPVCLFLSHVFSDVCNPCNLFRTMRFVQSHGANGYGTVSCLLVLTSELPLPWTSQGTVSSTSDPVHIFPETETLLLLSLPGPWGSNMEELQFLLV